MLHSEKKNWILAIETSTAVCAVAIGNGKVQLENKIKTPNGHASQLHNLILELLQNNGIKWEEIAAIAISKGPGSYTGLRIGMSAAKALSYTLQIPILALDSLQSMSYQCQTAPNNLIGIAVDARNDNAYVAIFDHDNNTLLETQFIKFDNPYRISAKEKYNVMQWFGPTPIIDFDIITIDISATALLPLAWKHFHLKKFDDVAYIEPNYINAAYITQAKNKW